MFNIHLSYPLTSLIILYPFINQIINLNICIYTDICKAFVAVRSRQKIKNN